MQDDILFPGDPESVLTSQRKTIRQLADRNSELTIRVKELEGQGESWFNPHVGLDFKEGGALLLTTTVTAYCTVTANIDGGLYAFDASSILWNGNSGAYRSAGFGIDQSFNGGSAVVLNGVATDVAVPYGAGNNPMITPRVMWTETLVAGSYRWRLIMNASANSAVYYLNPVLRVTRLA